MTTVNRTLLAGVAGGVSFGFTNFLTFGLFGGARRGQTGLLFDPDTQAAKVIAVWKEITPLPWVVTRPAVIMAAWVVFAVAHAFVYRGVAAAWPARLEAHAVRLAAIIWMSAAFAELMGPFNLLHEPFRVQVIELAFWSLSSLAEAFTIVALAMPRRVNELRLG
jgi:hypothetical protein